MDYESRETIAKVYEFLRMTHALVSSNLDSIEAMRIVLARQNGEFTKEYEIALAVEQASERTQQMNLMLATIDSVVLTLRAGEMGNA